MLRRPKIEFTVVLLIPSLSALARCKSLSSALSEADLAAVSVRRNAANRLGFAVQLCLLRYP